VSSGADLTFKYYCETRLIEVLFFISLWRYFMTMFVMSFAFALNSFRGRLTPELSNPHLFLLRRHFSATYIWSSNRLVPRFIALIGQNSNPSVSFIKGCRSINKTVQFWFIPWLGRSALGFHTHSLPTTAQYSLVYTWHAQLNRQHSELFLIH